MPETYTAERTISAVFKEQKQVDDVIRRLLDRGVSRDHISVMGRNFQSETRIAGFISKRDVILGGLSFCSSSPALYPKGERREECERGEEGGSIHAEGKSRECDPHRRDEQLTQAINE